MENYIGKVCPFCKTEIKEGDSVKVCPACNIPHHEGCWEENKGCTTFGCSEQHYEAQGTNPTAVCSNCGSTLGDGQEFCTKCGTPKNASKKNVCGKCGTELQDGQEFCPKCGQKAGLSVDAGVNSAISQFNAGVEKKNKKKATLPIILGVVAVIAVALFLLLRGPSKEGPDFKAIYNTYCSSTYATVGSDGSYLSIDTNPYDLDDYIVSGSLQAIIDVNSALGLPDYVLNDMGSTTALMGRQTATFDDVTVSWSFHPDKGLEVTYKAN